MNRSKLETADDYLRKFGSQFNLIDDDHATDLGITVEQDWDELKTTFHFSDGSKIVFSGTISEITRAGDTQSRLILTDKSGKIAEV